LLVAAERSGVVAAAGTGVPWGNMATDVASVTVVLVNATIVALIIADATAMYELRAGELAAAKAALEEKTRVLEQTSEELEAFTPTVAHDLKSPVGAILLTADMLLEEVDASTTPATRESIARLVHLAKSADAMIADLQVLMRVSATAEESRRVALDALVADVI